MKKAFIDQDGLLTCWGYVQSNNDDIPVDVPDDFDLKPGLWRRVSSTWVPVAPPEPPAKPQIARPASVTNVAQLRKTVSDLLDVLLDKGVIDVIESP